MLSDESQNSIHEKLGFLYLSYFVYEMTVKSSMIQTHILSLQTLLDSSSSEVINSVEILGRKSGILQSEQYALMTTI